MTRLKPSAETLGPCSRGATWCGLLNRPLLPAQRGGCGPVVPRTVVNAVHLVSISLPDNLLLTLCSWFQDSPVRCLDGSAGVTPLGLVGVSSWRPWWAGAPLLEPAHDRTVGRVHCPKWSLDLFLLQGLPLETRWLPGQRPVGGARPELVRYHVRLAWVHVAGVLRLKRLLTYISPIDIGLQGSASPVTNGCAASVSRCPLV